MTAPGSAAGTITGMSAASRRKARRARQARVEAAKARVARRRADIDAGLRKGPRVYSRKDREAVSIGYGPRKQRLKHAAKRHARWNARRIERLAAVLARLRAATAGAPVQPLTLDVFGSSCPFIAGGTVTDPADQTHTLLWEFRYRYDRAFLEVGHPDTDPEFRDLVGDCVLAASRDDVTGDPYQGWLGDDEAVRLVGELFTELVPPARGARWCERAQNTLDLLHGDGDPQAPTLIRYAD